MQHLVNRSMTSKCWGGPYFSFLDPLRYRATLPPNPTRAHTESSANKRTRTPPVGRTRVQTRLLFIQSLSDQFSCCVISPQSAFDTWHGNEVATCLQARVEWGWRQKMAWQFFSLWNNCRIVQRDSCRARQIKSLKVGDRQRPLLHIPSTLSYPPP